MTSANPAPSPFSKARRKRGFNLIEAAIVLGVVGLVIGGIWTAASAVRETLNIRDTVDGTILIADCAQNLLNRRNAPQGAGQTNIYNLLIAAGCIPRQWITSDTSEGKNPFGGRHLVFSIDGNRIDIYYLGISKEPCIKIANRLSIIGAQAGSLGGGATTRAALGYIGINSWSTNSFPASLSALEAACNPINNQMIFTYGYRAN